MPAVICYEVDTENERYATRMAEISADGTVTVIRDETCEFVTEAPVPTAAEIDREDDNFHAEIITKEEFDEINNKNHYSGNISFPE